jgi:hypothetical protein
MTIRKFLQFLLGLGLMALAVFDFALIWVMLPN